ncbi:MAG TPA: hypothetical protein VMA31_09980 [Bryobacteraceae bacterium]|nr:hypothetical protein [Bryobacteraceae bacterium]
MALSLVNSISTRTAREGDYVYMRTATPIAADGHVVVPVGSYVQGVVTSSKRSGRVKGRAELSIRLENLTLPSGKMVRIAPKLESVDSDGTGQKTTQEGSIKQAGSKGADAARVATLGGTGAAIGGLATETWRGAGIGAGIGGGVGAAVVLLTRGREVNLHRGETVDVVFQRAVPVE